MHQPHQSEPVKSISTILFSALAVAWADGKSVSQEAADTFEQEMAARTSKPHRAILLFTRVGSPFQAELKNRHSINSTILRLSEAKCGGLNLPNRYRYAREAHSTVTN